MAESLHEYYEDYATQQHNRYTDKVINNIVKSMPKARKSQEAILKRDIMNRMLGKHSHKKHKK